MKKNELYLFPNNYDTKIVISNKEFVSAYSDVKIVPLKEQRKDFVGILSHDDSLDNCRTLVLSDNISQLKLEPYIQMLKNGLYKSKRVCMSSLMERVLKTEFPEHVGILEKAEIIKENWMPNKEIEYLTDIPVPVVSCIGINENCDKFNLQMEIYKMFKKRGYKCSVITSNPLGIFFDMHIVPEFMYDENMSLERKILNFNHFVRTVALKEKSDIVLIGVPGAIMPMNNSITNHFSEVALAIGAAIETDIAVLNINYVPTMNQEFLEELGTLAKYKLSMPVEMFAISNQRVSFNTEDKELDINYLSDEFINSHHSGLDKNITYPIFYMADKEDMRINLQKIVEMLVGNIDAI